MNMNYLTGADQMYNILQESTLYLQIPVADLQSQQPSQLLLFHLQADKNNSYKRLGEGLWIVEQHSSS